MRRKRKSGSWGLVLVLIVGVVSLCAHKNKGQEEKTVSEKVERCIDAKEDVAVQDNNTVK